MRVLQLPHNTLKAIWLHASYDESALCEAIYLVIHCSNKLLGMLL